MKKLLMLLLLLPFCFALAEEPAFAIHPTAVLPGMERAYGQGYEPRIDQDTLTLHLPIEVRAKTQKIQITLVPRDERLSPFTHQSMSAAYPVPETRLVRARLSLRLMQERANGDYPCSVLVEAKSADGAPLKAEIPITIRIREQKNNAENGTPLISTAAALKVGEQSVMKLKVHNPNKTQRWENVHVQVTDLKGEILTIGKSLISMEDIAPEDAAEAEIPLSVSPKASADLHTLTISLSYRTLGETVQWQESLTLPVKQDMRLVQGGIDAPSSVIHGDLAAISLPLMNMGTAEIRNVLATLNLNGAPNPQSVLIGTLTPGETKTAKLSLRTEEIAIGKASGILQVDFEDASGHKDSLSLPLSLTIQEKPKVLEENADDAKGKQQPLVVYVLGGGCGLLILLLVLQGVLLRRRIHLMEEDRL